MQFVLFPYANYGNLLKMDKVLAMPFAKIYNLLIAKALKKGRTTSEVYEVTSWLLGYTTNDIVQALDNANLTYGEFITNAPNVNPNAYLITGKICNVKVEDISDPIEQRVRYLDKLIDELAKGKPLTKILRK